MAVRTIFAMAEDCTQGVRAGWFEFVRDYGEIGSQLLRRYFPSLIPEMDEHLPAVFLRARADHNAWFRRVRFSNEREFAMAFRELLFGYGREVARIPAPEMSLDQLRDIMHDLPMVERAMLWMFVKGYNAQELSPILMNAEATATATRKLADERLAKVLPSATPEAFNASARVLIEAAEKTKTEKCLSLKTFNNIVNGQITWRERELAEEHIRDCFNCLDRFTSFQEMIRLRKDAQPLPEPAAEKILARLGLPAGKSKGLLGKLFARG